MAKMVPPLTVARIEDAIRLVKRGKDRVGKRLFDGGGLVVEIRQDGGGIYPYSLGRVPVPVGPGQPPRRREMGLGAVDLGTEMCARRKAKPLADRRKEATDALAAVANGTDPIDQRRRDNLLRQAGILQSLQAEKVIPTFGEVVPRYVEKERGGWTSDRYAANWAKAVGDHAGRLFPLRVDLIERQHVRDALKASWVKHPVTAQKVRARIEAIMNYATAEGWRSGDNPATLKAIEYLMPKVSAAKTEVEHMGAIPWRRIGEMMVALESSNTVGAAAARFTILTCTR